METRCYWPIDKLLASQGKIQKALAGKRLGDGCLVLYDITSSCMEGEFEGSGRVEYGYNRDKKRRKKQVAVSLLCGKGGCPVAVDVFPGNTKDETAVVGKIDGLQKKYGIKQVVFVGGRGMVTAAQYEKTSHETVKVVSAPTHAKIKELCGKGVVLLGFFDEQPIVEAVEGGMRCCLCKKPEMAGKEGRARQALLDKTKEALDKAVNSTRKCKNSKEAQAGRVLDKHKMAKFVVFSGSGDNLAWSFDEKKIEAETVLDGCYAIYTDVDEASMPAVEAVESYKGLASVEKAFRRMKTAWLVRPFNYKTDPRIERHVFICTLACCLMWHMDQRLQPLYAQDGVGGKRKYTFGYVIVSLKAIRENVVSIEGVQVPVIIEPNEEQEFIKFLLENPA
ncbi:MAG: IS1634 family transposase [Eubacteriaceae bacterium]|nr:IS1634 family transposase [Eubacteriaceae bacterium]